MISFSRFVFAEFRRKDGAEIKLQRLVERLTAGKGIKGISRGREYIGVDTEGAQLATMPDSSKLLKMQCPKMRRSSSA